MNTMKKFLYGGLAAVAALWGVSCTEDADLDTGEVFYSVQCVLTNSSVQTVKICYGATGSSKTYRPVENAEVTVSYDSVTLRTNQVGIQYYADSVYSLDFSGKGNGVWETTYRPVSDRKYVLSVKIDGVDEIKDSTVFPNRFSGYSYAQHDAINTSVAWTRVYSFYSMGGMSGNTFWIYGMCSESDGSEEYSIADKIYTDTYYVDDFNISNTRKVDVPEFQTSETEGVAYEDLPYCALKDGRLDSEDALMHDKYLRLEFPDTPYEDLVFSPYDDYTDQKPGVREAFSIIANFKPSIYEPTRGSHIVMISVSDEYDKYLKDLAKQDLWIDYKYGRSDISNLWETKQVYSSFAGTPGVVGIFGAEYRVEFLVK